MSDDLPFGSQGGVAIRHHFPSTASTRSRCLLRRQLYATSSAWASRTSSTSASTACALKRFTIGGEGEGHDRARRALPATRRAIPSGKIYMHTADADLEVRVPVTAGPHEVGVSFVRRLWEPEGILQPPQTRLRPHDERAATTATPRWTPCRSPVRYGVARGAGDSPSRRTIFVCRPRTPRPRRAVRADRFCRRSRRAPIGGRSPTSDVADAAAASTREGRGDGGFDAGIQRGLERILAAPSFLFRVERDPAAAAPGSRLSRSSDLELASRLSFFLWSSIPDDELLDAGGSRPAAAIRRCSSSRCAACSRDPRSKALVDNFAAQWLKLRKLAGVVPDPELFPEFDENLRDAMQQETELFIAQPAARGSQRRRPADRRTTRSSTSGWRGTTGFPTSTAATSGASRSPTARAAGCSARRAS